MVRCVAGKTGSAGKIIAVAIVRIRTPSVWIVPVKAQVFLEYSLVRQLFPYLFKLGTTM